MISDGNEQGIMSSMYRGLWQGYYRRYRARRHSHSQEDPFYAPASETRNSGAPKYPIQKPGHAREKTDKKTP